MARSRSLLFFLAAIVAMLIGTGSRADAAMIALICNDFGCTGNDDIRITDNMAGDTNPTVGAIGVNTSAFGFSVLVNTSQSKPVLGSASDPALDLGFTATNDAGAGGNVFLLTTDTDFTGTGSHGFTLSLGGSNAINNGTVTGRAWGASNNTEASFSGANLLGTAVGPFTAAAYSGSTTGTYTPLVTPYSLTIGVAINRTLAGSTTGNLSFSTTGAGAGGGSGAGQTIPEPASVFLMGLGFAGAAAYRRRKASQNT